MTFWIAYVDEAGDDGLPGASPLFVLSAVYLHYLDWQDTFEQLRTFRRQIKARYGLPIKTEIHTRPLLRGKKPYSQLLSRDPARRAEQAKEILDDFCNSISTLPFRSVNVVILKPIFRMSSVLDTATTFLIQRIENDLRPWQTDERFLLITDPGREVPLRKTARRIRRYNPVPSLYGGTRQMPIRSLIEDPLPKEAQQSYFIQVADFWATVVYLYIQLFYVPPPKGQIPSRIAYTLTRNQPSPQAAIMQWMDTLRTIFNTSASKQNPYGVVIYPAPLKQ